MGPQILYPGFLSCFTLVPALGAGQTINIYYLMVSVSQEFENGLAIGVLAWGLSRGGSQDVGWDCRCLKT